MKKKFIFLLTALSMTIMFLGTPINITAAAEGGCDGTHSGMSAWTNENDLPTSGNYYLDTDVNLSSAISIRGSLTLCLNGHTIAAASGKQIFSISDSLTLCDCSSGKTGKLIGGGNVSFSGGAVDLTGSGTFTMNGGTISGNTAGTGGGVYVRSGASFIMNGGTISNNITSSNGGGVYSSGIFTMNGGTISGNTTNSNAGGGVFVAGSGTFIMNGGMISSNTAAIRGGGVYVNGGTFTMSGGIISGNTTADSGGGVGINGTFEINGKVNISGNTKTDGSDNNVYLFTGKKISIGNDFNTSSTIGVNTEAELANCQSYVDVTETCSDVSDSFTADIDGQSIVYNGGKVQLTKAHDYSTAWTTDDTNHWHKCQNCDAVSDEDQHTGGTAACSAKAVCEICGNGYGEYDPDNHNFVDGVCECGETDPTYNQSGSVAEDVQDTAGTNAGLVQNNTLIESALTAEEKTEVVNGHSFKIVLEVTDIRNSVSPADVTAASSVLSSGEEIGVYVDLSLFKIKDNDTANRTPIHNANGQIGITLTIPNSIYAADRTYSMIRVHGGIAENLGGTYDEATRSLTFYTDKFSTYAIAFTASSVSNNSPTIPSTSIGGGTTTVSPPTPAVTPPVTNTSSKEEEIIYGDDPYMEDVSSGAGETEDSEPVNIPYPVIIVLIAVFGIYFKRSKKYSDHKVKR